MKIVLLLLPLFCLAYSCQTVCGCVEPPDSQTNGILMRKTNGWKLESVQLPLNKLSIEEDWEDFTLNFSDASPSYVTNGHPQGMELVWPSGQYSIGINGDEIIRETDQVVMKIDSLTDNYL